MDCPALHVKTPAEDNGIELSGFQAKQTSANFRYQVEFSFIT